MAKTIATTVTFLEMTARPHLPPVPVPSNLRLMLLKAEKPPVHYYRYLYDTVGRGLYWIDRKKMDDATLQAAIHDENTAIFVLHAGGVPAGFYELAKRDDEVEILYFGLMAEFHGLGLGKWFLASAIEAAWDMGPARVIVETCTLDGPAALPLYQRMGFVPYGRKDKVTELPKGFKPTD